jgi:putative ABC transport system permease protein
VSFSQVKETILELIGTTREMVLAIAVIAIVIAMVGAVTTVLTSVLERRQEIGVVVGAGLLSGLYPAWGIRPAES